MTYYILSYDSNPFNIESTERFILCFSGKLMCINVTEEDMPIIKYSMILLTPFNWFANFIQHDDGHRWIELNYYAQ